MSFVEELKRRNVFRVGIAYAVTVWVLIQAFSIFLPTFDAPQWVMKVISLVLIAGFPVVLIFAWAYELTPEGLKRDGEVNPQQSIAPQTGKKLNHAIIVLMAVAISFLLFDRFSSGPGSITEPGAGQAEVPAPVIEPGPTSPNEPTRQSIAVLPFDNRSMSAEDEFFVEGIHDDLLTNLARIGSLKVISRTSVGKYQDTQLSIPEIARELGVATIMEGAVQRAGDTVRINVQLIDANTDEHLWAEIFDRQMTAENLFAIQSEISEKIADALKATLSAEERQRINVKPTENLAAYNAYLRGRQLLAQRNSESVDQAAAEFRRAVDLDPEFALGWASIAEAAGLQARYSDLDLLESLQIRRNATERALALNNQLGEAHLAKAGLLEEDELYPEAEASYLRAIDLSPGNATAYQQYADFLSIFAVRRSEALGYMQRALELDPMSSIVRVRLGGVLMDLGRFEAAEQQLNELVELDPGFAATYSMLAELKSRTGRMDEQVRWIRKSMELDPGRLALSNQLLWAYMSLGDTESMLEIRAEMAAVNPDHMITGFVDLSHGMYTGNLDAAQESAQWVNQRIGRQPWFQRIFGFLNNMAGDYAAARANFVISDPEFFNRSTWDKGLEANSQMGCFVGWILLQTGDEGLGNDLLDYTENFLLNQLPGHIEHADQYDAESCFMARGQVDKALDYLEVKYSHRHYGGWYFLRKHPQFEPLWGHPRFEAAMRQVEKEMAIQRANLRNEAKT